MEDVKIVNTVNLLVAAGNGAVHTLEDPDKLGDCNRYKERD